VVNGDTMESTMIRVADPNASTPSWQKKDHFQIPARARAGTS